VPTAARFLKTVGLLADGPVKWGSPVRSTRPGIAIVELPVPLAQAPVDVAICGKWAERLATLLLDGERPDGRQLARRLASFWLASQTVLYVVSTEKSLGGRVGALYATELGSRRPHSGGHWLKTLRGLDGARVWWAETDAVLEYEDAILTEFAAGVPAAEAAALHDPDVVLPFANLATALGRRSAMVWRALLAAEERPRRDRASVRPASSRSGRRPSRPTAAASTRDRERRGPSSEARAASAEPTYMSPSGLKSLQAELAELGDVQRPAVVARIKAARELGDLRENADYEAARREQSFIEGRIQAIEAILRNARVVDDETIHEVIIGSTVVLERDGESIVQDRRLQRGESGRGSDLVRVPHREGPAGAPRRRRRGCEGAVRRPTLPGCRGPLTRGEISRPGARSSGR
jgi:hypothetical protein